MNVVFRHNIPHILFNNNKISIRRDYWKIFTIYQEFEERQQKNLINIINNIINKNIIGIKTCFYRIWSSFIYVEHFSVDFHLILDTDRLDQTELTFRYNIWRDTLEWTRDF